MWYLELFGEITDISIVDVSSPESILSCLETDLDTGYPEDFPYGVHDVEVIDTSDTLIEIIIIYEDHHVTHERYQTTLHKV